MSVLTGVSHVAINRIFDTLRVFTALKSESESPFEIRS